MFLTLEIKKSFIYDQQNSLNAVYFTVSVQLCKTMLFDFIFILESVLCVLMTSVLSPPIYSFLFEGCCFSSEIKR